MRVYIAADIEGVAGIVSFAQALPAGGVDYERARSLMVGEVNAAVGAAFDAGAEAVLVNDGHGPNTNLRAEELDERAELMSGRPKPLNQMQCIDDGFDALAFVGFHARAGTSHAILDHTYVTDVADVRVQGQSHGEFGLNAMLAGRFGVPVAFASGDDKFVEEVHELAPDVRAVEVKRTVARTASRSVSPAEARRRIREGLYAALTGGMAGATVVATPPPPLDLEVEFLLSSQADTAALLPRSERSGPRSVRFVADDYVELFRACRALLLLGRAGKVAE